MSLPQPSRTRRTSHKDAWSDCLAELMKPRFVFRSNGMIFDCRSKCFFPRDVRRICVRKEFSHQPMDPECCANSNSIPLHRPTFVHPILIVQEPYKCLLWLFLLLSSAIPWVQNKSSQALSNSKYLSMFSTVGTSPGWKNFRNLSTVSCEVLDLRWQLRGHWVAKPQQSHDAAIATSLLHCGSCDPLSSCH